MGFLDSIKGLLGAAPAKTEEELALLRAIAEQPSADEPRLAYADYLEQKKDPLGAYIRADVTAHRLPEADPRKAKLAAEADELLTKHGKKWVRPLKELELEPMLLGMYLPALWFQRGMIEEVTVDKRAIVPGKLDRLLELAPALRKIVFARCSPLFNDIANAPQMKRITALDLADVKATLPEIQLLAASPHLSQLVELVLDDKNYGAALAAVIAGSKQWKRLKALKVTSCGLGSEGAQQLAAAANLSQLEELDISSNDIGHEGLAALTISPHLANLRVLRCRSNNLSPIAAKHLVSATWRHLQELDLNSNALGAEGVAALARAAPLAHLQTLKLSWNHCGDIGAIAWAKSPQLESIRVLDLSGNDLTDQAIAALAQSRHATNLRELDLSGNPFKLIAALKASPVIKQLTKLKLYSSELSDDDKAELHAALGEDVIDA